MGMGNGRGNGKSSNWKNFISLWEKDSGALQATGILNLESFCKVLKDNSLATEDQARDLYRMLRDILGEDGLNMRIACWGNKDRKGKQPHFNIGYSIPQQGVDSSRASAPQDDVPF